jgi:hypothetical protein
MSDYEQLTDAELRELIARQLGWKGLHSSYGKIEAVPPNARPGSFVEVPNWPQSCDDALALHEGACVASMFVEMHNQWTAWVNPSLGKAYTGFAVADAVNPRARAICIAWLMWRDVEDGRANGCR